MPNKNSSVYTGEYVCDSCRKKLIYTGDDVCVKCGKPVQQQQTEYCLDCARKKHIYKQGRAVFVYDKEIRRSLYRFKYSNRRAYAEFYAGEAARIYGDWIRQKNIEAIVPIPLHPRKERERGYNQAEIFAKELGKILEIPVKTDVLERIVYTKPQKELNDTERRKNLNKALKILKKDVKLRYILLVDDIYTTGSTIDAAAEAFAECGSCVYFITISIGRGY